MQTERSMRKNAGTRAIWSAIAECCGCEMSKETLHYHAVNAAVVESVDSCLGLEDAPRAPFDAS